MPIDRNIAQPSTPLTRTGGTLRHLMAFGLVGGVGTASHYAVLFGLVKLFDSDVVAATTLGAVTGAIVNFLLNHHFTFSTDRPLSATGPRFLLVVVIGIACNALLMHLFHDRWQTHLVVAQLLSTGIVFVVNFVLCKQWVFKERR